MMWPFEKKPVAPARPKRRSEIPEHQHVIGGFWGNHMRFSDSEANTEGYFRLWGHKPFHDRPKEGQIIKAEFMRSWVWLEITNVEWCGNPNDMYFLDAYPVFQEMKEGVDG